MSLSVADIDRWDAGSLADASRAANSRAQASDDAAQALARLPAFASWDGEAAIAARTSIGVLRKELSEHSQVARQLARAIDSAADALGQLKSQLEAIRGEALIMNVVVEAATSTARALTDSPENAVTALSIQRRIMALVAQAKEVDSRLTKALAAAIAADEPPKPSIAPTLHPQDSATQAKGLPGSPLVSTGELVIGNGRGTSRVMLGEEVPAGFTDLSMNSDLAKKWGAKVELDPDNDKSLVGMYSGNLLKPNPQDGPMAEGSTSAGIPGWTAEDGSGKRTPDILDIDAVKGAKLRVVSATPVALSSFDTMGTHALEVNYQYHYQVQYTYTALNNAIQYSTKWADVSDGDVSNLQAMGVNVPRPQ